MVNTPLHGQNCSPVSSANHTVQAWEFFSSDDMRAEVAEYMDQVQLSAHWVQGILENSIFFICRPLT